MTETTAEPQVVLRPHAEDEHRAELAALATADNRPRPPGWRLSPWAVTTYLLGGQAGGTEITPKYVGSRRQVEVAVATLATILGAPPSRSGSSATTSPEPVSPANKSRSTAVRPPPAGVSRNGAAASDTLWVRRLLARISPAKVVLL